MSDKQQIQNIKTNIERTIQGLRTKLQEFTYVETGGFVKPNQLYSVYYTLGKRKRYLTGITQSSNSRYIQKQHQQNHPKVIIGLVKYQDILHKLVMIIPSQFLKYQKKILVIKVIYINTLHFNGNHLD